MSSLTELFYRLRLRVGAHFGDVPINVLPQAFGSSKFMAESTLRRQLLDQLVESASPASLLEEAS